MVRFLQGAFPPSMNILRRQFICTAAAAVIAASLANGPIHAATSAGGIPLRRFGRTQDKISALGVGGAHLNMGGISEADAITVVRTMMDAGVNFMDNSWDYSDGETERRMGLALRDGYRDRAFVMTKVDGRSAKVATQQLDQCLQRLQTDHLDLIQLHDVARMDDPARFFQDDGAIAGLVAAKKAGKVRYIGFTGHKSPAIHLHTLKVAEKHSFHFDAVQMPINVMDAHFSSFADRVVPVLRKKGMAVLGMKPFASGEIMKSNTVTAQEVLRYAMHVADVCITGCDSLATMRQAVDVAKGFQPLSHDELAAILSKTEVAAGNGRYEYYKTTSNFDNSPTDPNFS